MIDVILGIGSKLIDRLWTDPEKRAQAQLELFRMQQAGELQAMAAQLEVNKAEASHPSMLVAGWRPAVGWVCVSGFAIQFVVGPLAVWGSMLIGRPTQFPQLDMSTMLPMLAGMLGLGGLRTFEKINRVAAK